MYKPQSHHSLIMAGHYQGDVRVEHIYQSEGILE